MTIKRLFDVILSTSGIVIFSPVFLLIALAVKIDNPGPIFYRQARVGRWGKHFRIHKFRTMVVGADRIGPRITSSCDVRVTPVGRFLRKRKLDELPQLIDVFLGRMSIVGPRPEVSEYVKLYPVEVSKKVLSVRPGITDRASIMFRDEETILGVSENPNFTYVNNILPQKLKIYCNYVDCQSFYVDVKIILDTLFVLIK